MTAYPARLRSARSRNIRYITLVVLVLALTAGWAAFWKYAAGKGQEAFDGWRAREAKAGRVYACGSQTLGGFPFRVEISCDRASAVIKSAQPPVELKARAIHAAAQIYSPSLLISEITGPLTIGEPGKGANFTADWKLFQSSVRGTPQAPQRVSLVFENPTLERVAPAGNMLKAKRIEIHGRIAEGSAASKPVIDVAVRTEKLSAPAAGPVAAIPVDSDIEATVRGLNDFSPKPWPQRFREIQQAGGRIDIVKARLQQGDTVAIGSGTLTINERGKLDGQLNMAVAGLDNFINAIGAANKQQGLGFSIGLGLLGGNATVEGRQAIALPLKFSDGTVYFGPFRITEVAPLF